MASRGIFDSIKERLAQVGELEGLNKDAISLLSSHKQVSVASLKVKGKEYKAWRIIHNNALGPGKGGIRFHPGVSEDEVKSLSFWMSLKNSLAGLPYGGGKGGVKFDPKSVSPIELEAISRAYGAAFYEVIGQDKDIPAPDVYTDGQIMSWILDEYEKRVGHHEPGVITGKPIELGGLALRSDSTAHGGYIVLSEMAKRFKLDKKKLTIAIQGFGNAGANMAKYLIENGYKVVAVSDSRGGTYCEKGLDYTEITRIKNEKGTVAEYPAGMMVSNEDLLELSVDILVLAALENQVTKENAGNINARYIIELANGPVTPEADEILHKQGTVVVPDILANAGGVVVSYFEWAQNRTGNILDEKYLEQKLVDMMTSSWNRVVSLADSYHKKIDLRTAAYIIAIRRILAAEKYRGNLA